MPEASTSAPRQATVTRKTSETDISATLSLDGTGTSSIQTGVGFLDHMLTSFSRHSRIDLAVICKGDLEVDDHHSVEDVAIVIGSAILQALGSCAGIRRFGSALVPMDESLARAAVDLGGRSFAVVKAEFGRPVIQGMSTEMVGHFFTSIASGLKANIHIAVLDGHNTHHMIEAMFKAFALAMKDAVRIEGGGIPSTKGVL
ncbi:MAG: imidazoleglycerol-phosphate dehydratase [Pelodictyon luteolum]|uniref:Imidazoleglycerol-phosphate dehydratase n=1 Tax=Pelodictyon luteolum TaxID=1100 RepID=A0A165LSM9_PELLU|nr:imidazoleglycerol-phosphate dehydratase HisB [Pelodictyon luteolum]KZK74377.1 MAG: imidazoleglycerol-phosphate dehydratase [Pelodictyon luteolum]